MKQKRKVKSLLSQRKDLNGGFMTALLLALGLALCLGSATLMTTSSVGAAGVGQTISNIPYSGLDDKVEVLYNLQFSQPNNLSGIVGEMYTDKNNDFYITSTPLIVNLSDTGTHENKVRSGVYSNILGGIDNVVNSKNITIIGGERNKIAESNDNAVILGGIGNEIRGTSSGVPSVIIGGENNILHGGQNGDAIIGGKSNTIGSNVSNSFILGGSGNTINTNNAIVGGTNVTVNTGDVFVFSNDGAFEPQTPKTFYLNLEGGLGINTGSAGKGVTVNGPVKFGEINITVPSEYPCDNNHLGMVGMWSVGSIGCLVGCTSSSATDFGPSGYGKWDLLDRGEMCQDLCDDPAYSDYCSQKKPEVPEINIHYNSFCTTGMNGITNTIVDVSNASPCTPVWDQIENVVYETTLIDAADVNQCPANAANKCIYQCNSGYHLTGDTTGKFPGNATIEKCFSDCNLVDLLGNGDEWKKPDGTPIILKHNETITGYNKREVPCSYHKYTGIGGYVNYLDNGYGTKRNGRGPLGKDTKSTRYELPETCTNNAHQQVLVCVNGQVYIANNDGKTATTTLAKKGGTTGDNYVGYAHSGYIYKSCHTTAYTCNTGQYDLEEVYIINSLYDTGVTIKPSNPSDRNILTGTRGVYKLCLDYMVDPNNNMGCKVNVPTSAGNTTAYDKHYEFKRCNTGAGYHPTERAGDDSRVCRKECKVTTNDNVNVTKRDQYEITLYNTADGKCTAIDDTTNTIKHCESKTFKCDDGTWKDLSGNVVTTNDIRTTFGYSKCLQSGNPCTGYNVSTGTYNGRQSIGDNISNYSVPCHRMHAYNPYPAPSEGPWNKRYKDNTGPKVHDFGIPNTIQWACEDNDWWRKLIGCNNLCYHANSLNTSNMNEYMQYCVKDVKDESMCPDNSNYIKAGRVYNLWEGVWNSGSWGTGTCSYYCPKDTYDNGSQCVDNPICEFPTYDPNTEFVVTSDNDTIQGGHTNYYIVKNKETGADLRRSTVCIHCNEGYGFAHYHQEGNRCVRNTHSCVGDLPTYSSHGTSTTYDGSIKEWTYKESGTLNACEFRCNTNYQWDGYTCREKECGNPNNLCTITYDAGEGTPSKTSETVVCGTEITLADASRHCYDFTSWKNGSTVIGNKGGKYTLRNSITVSPNWSYDVGQCPYQCIGSEYPAGGHVEINSNPGNNTGLNWQFVSGYNVTLGPCQWSCERGYMRGTGTNIHTCVEKPCGTDSSHVKPTGSTVRYLKTTYVGLDGVKWTYTGTTVGNATQPDNNTPNFDTTQNKEKCLWTCQPGYTRSGSTCVKRTCYVDSTANNRSTSPSPSIANSKQGTGLYKGVDNRVWTSTGVTNPGPCEWTCTGGYTQLRTSAGCQNKCVPIHNGKCMSNGSRRVDTYSAGYCYTGTHGDINTTTYTNKYTWDCISNNVGNVCYSDNVGTNQESCYRCKPGYTGSACNEIRNASCNNDVELGCKYTGVTAATSAKDGILDYQTTSTIYWHCNGKNGGSPANGCFKCKYGYRRDSDTEACIEINDGCGDAPRNGDYCVDSHAEVTKGAQINGSWVSYYDSSTHQYTWKCQTNTCQVCDGANGYSLRGGICKNCNNCAVSGFPYCFPIDLRDNCDESRYPN